MSGLSVHLRQSVAAVASLEASLDHIARLGELIGRRLASGGRLLAAGNGGSAAHAQHLTAELVGRYRDERRPLSALALHAETSSLTALANDYGATEVFARQVEAHGRRGDVLVAFSTSGRSRNILEAVRRGRQIGMWTVGFAGPAPNPLSEAAEDSFCVEAPNAATVQEAHQVALHLLCEAVDAALAGQRCTTAPLAGAHP